MNDSPTLSYSSHVPSASRSGNDRDIQHVITDSETVLREIQQLLQSLSTLKSSIEERLVKAQNTDNGSTNITALEYILQNCETQHRELRKQVQRVEHRIRDKIKRHRVLKGSNARRDANDRSDLDHQLAENQSLLNAINIVDQNLTLQSDVNEDMRNQGIMTQGINHGLTLLNSKFPQAGDLIFKIKKYKNRDSIVLSCVCGTCLFFMFIYWLNK